MLTSVFWAVWSSVVGQKGLDALTARRHRGDVSEQRKLLFANAGMDIRNSLFLEPIWDMKVRRFRPSGPKATSEAKRIRVSDKPTAVTDEEVAANQPQHHFQLAARHLHTGLQLFEKLLFFGQSHYYATSSFSSGAWRRQQPITLLSSHIKNKTGNNKQKATDLKVTISIRGRTSVICSCFEVSHTVFSSSKADGIPFVELGLGLSQLSHLLECCLLLGGNKKLKSIPT